MKLGARPATKDDYHYLWELKVSAMKKLVERVHGWDERVQREYFAKHFDASKIQILLVDGKDAGMIRVVDRGDHVELGHIEIHPDYQMQGIGAKVIQGVMAKAKRAHRPVRLQVFKINPARHLYERLGFNYVGETETHYQMEYKG